MPLFSVIIPTYNRLALLQRTLDSVWAQRFRDFEVAVVDDGSTDGTAEWLDLHGRGTRVLKQTNRGPGAARNLGASQAEGEYLAFLDSDDLWFPWTLEIFTKLIREFRSPAILSAKLVEFGDETELTSVSEEPVKADPFPDYFASSRNGYFVGSGMSVLQRDAFLRTGGYTSQKVYAEDHDLILRMGTAAGFVQVLRPATIAWRRHAESATGGLQHGFGGGIRWLLEQEHRGIYPGGEKRARERRTIISRHVRPAALGDLRRGKKKEAWELYRATFRWNLQLRRWKFLAGFPLRACFVR